MEEARLVDLMAEVAVAPPMEVNPVAAAAEMTTAANPVDTAYVRNFSNF